MADQQAVAQAARYDQSRAAAAAAVDLLTVFLKDRASKAGEPKALADTCALLSGLPAAELAGLLTAALWERAGLNGTSGRDPRAGRPRRP